MKAGLRQATILAFEPSELAEDEKQRLFAALQAFVNLGDGLNEFLAFGKQNPNFFPVPIRDDSQTRHIKKDGQWRELTKAITWEPVGHKLALSYRNCLRIIWGAWYSFPGAYHPVAGQAFEILLSLETYVRYHGLEEALETILAVYKSAQVVSSPILADWHTGSFTYKPGNDFQRAVYILFRQGWRAKVCARCSRRFIADKPLQRYCSTDCFGEAKRERNLNWWNRDGKRLRMIGKESPHRKRKKLKGKRGE